MTVTLVPSFGLVIIRHTLEAADGVLQAALRLADLLAQAGPPKSRGLVSQDGAITAVMLIAGASRRGSTYKGWRVYELPEDAQDIVDAWKDLERAQPMLKATELFEDLHGGEDPEAVRPVQLELESTAAELGKLEAVEYLADRGDGTATYRHVFEAPLPVLAVSPGARRLLVLEGGYTVTERGIEG